MADVILLHQINRWLQSAKDACDQKDIGRAWSCCNQAQHNINEALRAAERQSSDLRIQAEYADWLDDASDYGAAAAFGLMGMAFAIVEREAAKRYATLMSYVATECECGPDSYNRCPFCRESLRDRGISTK